MVGNARSTEHLVLPLLTLDGHLQTGVRKRCHPLRKHPEHVHHVVQRHLGGLIVHAPFVHVYPTLTSGGVLALVPLLPCGGIGVLQFFQSVQTVFVGFNELYIGLARRFLRRHVLTRKPPVLVQHLHLKPSKDALYRLRLAIIRLCRPVHTAYLPNKTVIVQFLVPALVVVHDLPRLVLRRLHGHAVGVILGLVVLGVADAVAKQYLAHRIDHLIHLRGPHLALLIPIIEVQFRAVTIPQRVTSRRQCRPVLASVPLPCGLLAIHGIIPQGFHCRAVQPLLHAAKAPQRLPTLLLGYLVGSVKELSIGIHRHLASLQRHNHLQEVVGHLQCRGVAELAAHHALVAVFLPSLQSRLQSG